MSNEEHLGKEIVAEMSGLAHGGAAIGTISNGPPGVAGAKAFVRFTAPGEIAHARISAARHQSYDADLIRIERAHPLRRAAPCPLFGSCGGCDLQHMQIAAQREAKRDMVESMLRIQAKVTAPVQFAPRAEGLPEFGYRRKVTLHLSSDGVFGFYRQGTGDVIALSACLISSEAVNRGIALLAPLGSRLAGMVGAVIIEDTGTRVIFAIKLREFHDTLDPEVESELQKLGIPYVLLARDKVRGIFTGNGDLSPEEVESASAFSQVNAEGNELLIERVLAHVESGPITELYAGAGNFSLPLARRGIAVHAIEVSETLTALGRKRADEAKLGRLIRFVTASAERFVKTERLGSTVLLDPPRSGAKEVVKSFDAQRTPKIVYVSCAVPTLTRDIRSLVERGYRLKMVELVDMFPQTHHVESVAILEAV